ncbi:GNAT family N-acetyltransferase [Acinetobacter soli]|uniref:GNAT family N-acetyltransferase n=1 Tax=Acinetobacter soli TaxID=487316 RepID=UPI00321872E9
MVDEFRQIHVDEAAHYQHVVFNAYQSIRNLNINFDATTIDLEQAIRHLNQHVVYGLYREHQLIATVTVRMPWSSLPGPFGLPHIGNVAVHPDYKGQGISKLMLAWLEQNILLTRLKSPAYSLGTASNHPWLYDFYQKIGFQEICHKDLGKGHITIFMLKVLDSLRFNDWNRKNQVINYED